MGCRSIAWEPVPYFAAYLKYALLRNNMTHTVQVGGAAVPGPGRTSDCCCNQRVVLEAVERQLDSFSHFVHKSAQTKRRSGMVRCPCKSFLRLPPLRLWHSCVRRL